MLYLRVGTLRRAAALKRVVGTSVCSLCTLNVDQNLNQLVREKAAYSATPVSLTDVYRHGSSPINSPQRLRNAQFLHRELIIRIAQRCVELSQAPHGLAESRHIQEVVSSYCQAFLQLHSHPYPKNDEDEQAFTSLLRDVIKLHSGVVESLALGVLEVRSQQHMDWQVLRSLDAYLNRFFMARIGVRFLIEHHISSSPRSPQGFSGIIESKCSPLEVAKTAADEAMFLCRHHMGCTPEVLFEGNLQATFTYVPGHLLYIMTELLKNALRATVLRHSREHANDAAALSWGPTVDPSGPTEHPEDVGDDSLPPVTVVIADGPHDVTIKVSDRGGGIAYHDMNRIWHYLHSTAHERQRADEAYHSLLSMEGHHKERGVGLLAGYGCGLPLSRLYAQYFGGGLDLKSMEGYGTDAYCHLNRLGSNCESLPIGVRLSPAGRDSTPKDDERQKLVAAWQSRQE